MMTKTFFSTLILFIIFYTPATWSKPTGATDRWLGNFGFMIYCSTGLWPFDFDDYGCWCGFGGNGTPVDAIDECCKAHDHCYDQTVAANTCGDITEYLAAYSWNCQNKSPVCARKQIHCLCFK